MKEKILIYDVVLKYKVRTKAQAKELVQAVNHLYVDKVNKWAKIKLPKNFGKIKIDGKIVDF